MLKQLSMSKNNISRFIALSFFMVATVLVYGGGGAIPDASTFSASGGGTFCQYETPTDITTNTDYVACESGGATAYSYATWTYYEDADGAGYDGTAVYSETAGLSGDEASFTPPTSECGTTYYYVEMTWEDNANCTGDVSGSALSGYVEVTVDCSCSFTTISSTASQTITDCADFTWTDSGGTGGEYENDESYTITFCPDDPDMAIQVEFVSFHTDGTATTCYDPMNIYMNADGSGTPDDTPCGAVGSFTVLSQSEDGCVTFEFSSDVSVTEPGWEANVSCVQGCVDPMASFDQTPLTICPSTSLTPGDLSVDFDGSASTAGSGDFNIAYYDWDFGDGTTSSTTSATTTHTYEEGIYLAQLTVRDDNTGIIPDGCPSSNSMTRRIEVVPEPLMTEPTETTATCGECLTLTATETSQTAVQPLPVVDGDPILLPDGSGNEYQSASDFSGYFPDGTTMTSACYPTLCFDLEHSFSGDLEIILIAPDGTEVVVYDQEGGSTNFGDCVNGLDDEVAGCTANYCVVGDGSGTAWADGEDTAPMTDGNCDYTGACEGGDNYVGGTTFESSNPFSAFDGVELNGTWTLMIRDNLAADDGFLSGWSLTFPSECYDDLLWTTPDASDITWQPNADGPTPTNETQTTTAVSDPGPDPCPSGETCEGTQIQNSVDLCFDITELDGSSYQYDYIVTDEYGCDWERNLTVDVACLLAVELLSFEGEVKRDCNSITWETLTEINNDYFVLQRSTDLNVWTTVATIDGAGTSHEKHSYSYRDVNFEKRTINYYRLEQVDFDETNAHSKIISLNNEYSAEYIDVFPNPTTGDIEVTFNALSSGTATVTIQSSEGKNVQSKTVEAKKFLNKVPVNTSELAAGVYLITVQINDSFVTTRLIKK